LKLLPAIPLKNKYFKNIEDEIQKLFDELLYAPLFQIIKEYGEFANAKDDPLADAIRRGRVKFQNGKFTGKFNSKITKQLRDIGAKYSARRMDWAFDGALPPDVSIALVYAENRRKLLQNKILTTLDQINIERIDQISSVPDKYIESIYAMDFDFRKTAQAFAVAPQLLPAQAAALAADWGYNLDLYIKNWLAENIIELRQQVQQQVFAGQRPRSMERMIMDNYGVGQRKAKFLARQETALLMSKFHEQRYKEVGVTKYKWSTSGDERVRHDHKILNGKIISWDTPPVVDLETGRRAHAGEDFGCRCVAIPIIE